MTTGIGNRGCINYSDKLDAVVDKFHRGDTSVGDECVENFLDFPSTYGNHDTNGAIETGFGIAVDCPPDKMVWTGYSEYEDTRYYVYAKDEDDAIKVWDEGVKEAKKAARAADKAAKAKAAAKKAKSKKTK